MFSSEQPTKTNYTRRLFGVIIILLPLEIAIVSFLVGLLGDKHPMYSGIWFVFVGAFVATLNLYTHLFRPQLHKLLHHSMEGYRPVSGFPLIGEFWVTIGIIFGFGSIGTAILGVFFTLINTGGSLWFLIWTWKDKSFWDRK